MDRTSNSDLLHEGIRRLGFNVVRHDDHFHDQTPDEEWLTHAGIEGWIALTADKELERIYVNTIIEHKVKLVIFTDNNSGAPHWLGAFVNAHEDIIGRIKWNEPPIVIRLSRKGSVSTMRLKQDLIERKEAFLQTRIIRTKKRAFAAKK